MKNFLIVDFFYNTLRILSPQRFFWVVTKGNLKKGIRLLRQMGDSGLSGKVLNIS